MKNQKIDKKILELDGWEKRGVYDEPRLSELSQLYSELGYEVLILDYTSDEESCNSCLKNSPVSKYKILYTKKLQEG